MSIRSKIDDYLIEKMAKSKVNYLFAVSKETLLTRVHELTEEIELLRDINKKSFNIIEKLEKENNPIEVKRIIQTNNELHEELAEYVRRSEKYRMKAGKLEKENENLKSQISKGFDYERAYKGLVKEYEELTNENKSIKASVDMVSTVVENTKKQNEQLKDRLKRTESEKEGLDIDNKKLKIINEDLKGHLMKEQEYSASVDTTLKRANENKENKVVKHNFTAKRNNNNNKSMSLSK